MTVVYLDRVVLLNLAVDYLLLLATARLAGLPLRRGTAGPGQRRWARCTQRRYFCPGALSGALAGLLLAAGLAAGSPGPFSAGYITPTSAGRCCWAPP